MSDPFAQFGGQIESDPFASFGGKLESSAPAKAPAATSSQQTSPITQRNADYVYTNNGYVLNPMNPNAKVSGNVNVFDDKGNVRNLTIDASKVPGPTLISNAIKQQDAAKQSGMVDQVKGLISRTVGGLPPSPANPNDRSASQVRRDQSGAVIQGVGQAATGIPATLAAMVKAGSNPKAIVDLLQSAYQGVKQPVSNLANDASALAHGYAQDAGIEKPNTNAPTISSPQQQQQYANFAGQQAAPAIAGAVLEGAPRALSAVNSTDAANFVQQRAANSLIKPKLVDFNFGANPIGESLKIPPATTMGKYLDNVKSAIGDSETKLQQAITDQKAAAAASGQPNGIDVGPSVQAAFDDMAKQATRDGNTGLASRLQDMGDTRIAELKSKYGGTYLTPEEILAEKRALSNEVKFKSSDTEQMNVNAAKADMYRALDSNLDTLVPQAKDINAEYGSRIQLSKLLEKRLQEGMNAPMISTSSLPETVFKTNLMKLLNYGKNAGNTGGSGYQFYQPPAPNPYNIGGPNAVRVNAGPVVEPTIPAPATYNIPPLK